MKRSAESAEQNIISLKRRLLAKLNRQKLYNPRELLRPHRLDIAAKSMFARAYIERNTSVWPEEVYREHLRVWNNFYEKKPEKNGYNHFKDAFIDIIDATLSGEFKGHKSPVSIDRYGRFENGAHRLSVALLLDKFINTYDERVMTAGDWDYNFFNYWSNETDGSKLNEKYTDAMTIEYLRLAPSQMYAIVVFPSAGQHRDIADKRIREFGHVLNVKEIEKDKVDSTNVIRQLYAGEWWNDDEHKDDVDNKARCCFKGKGTLKVYIVRSPHIEESRRALKEELRELWKVDKHSIHISDTEEEVYRIATMFFHQNTRKSLAVKREVEYLPRFGNMFRHLLAATSGNINERENFLIDSSSVMALLGIRDANDIDYLYRLNDPLHGGDEVINSHMSELEWYSESVDELITHPEKHFYYNGIKFLDLMEVLKMKQRRDEEKDRIDVKLIKEYLKSHKELK